MFHFFKKSKPKQNIKKQILSTNRYIFNINPEKYKLCRTYLSNLTLFFTIASKYNKSYHYIAINEQDGKLYEIHTRVIGFEGAYTHTKAVEDFVFPPRELSIKDFLSLADSIYPGVSALYDGINESNLHLYKELLKSLHVQHNVAKQLPMGTESRKRICVFKQSTDNYLLWKKESEIYPLVAISEFLSDNGFTFEEAFVGGGITEISHTGSVAYNAFYSQFEQFRDNFANDIKLANEKAEREYQGWATIDYRLIAVVLNKDSTEIRIEINDKVNETTRIEWCNIDKSHEPIIEETKRKMISILGKGVETDEFYCI